MTGAAWRDGDVITLAITAGLGFSALAGGWFGASGTASVTGQVVWLTVAVAGFILAQAGLSLWLMRGRRAIGERRRALIAVTPAASDPLPKARMRRSAHSADVTAPLGLVRSPGMDKVHSVGCPLLAGKPTEPVALADGEPCGVCLG